MANVFDYLKWRGDLNLEKSSFNEIDNLILSRFSYFPFDNIIKEESTEKDKGTSKLPTTGKESAAIFISFAAIIMATAFLKKRKRA